MSTSRIDSEQKNYEKLISEIIQGELIDLYGPGGYKSIMQTMKNNSGKSEKEIISNYELFAKLTEGIFGRLAEPKILEPIKLTIAKIGEENIQQEQKIIENRPMRLLIADDETEILELYKTFFEFKGREVEVTTDEHKCVEAYKRKCNPEKQQNYFDVVLDQKMPIMTGLQAAVEILNINPQQKIIFASGYLEKTLLDVLTKLNRVIAVIEKPFSLDVLDHMINNSVIFEELEKINLNQEEKDIKEKMSEVMTVLEKQV